MFFNLFTMGEIFDALVMSFVIGLIFSDFFSRYNRGVGKSSVIHKGKEQEYDPLSHYSKKLNLGPLSVNWEDMKLAMIAIVPAIILHELGHKFTAMGFGVVATFQISYFFLGIALLLKVMNAPFIFLVPAFVSYPAGIITPLQSSMVAFAGPAVNFAIFGISYLILKKSKNLSRKTILILGLTKQVNLFLGIFNMIPLRPFDGGHVVAGLIQTLF
ncbi:MAG: metalloprotease [Nanoarchaeota archaeon]